MPLVPGRRLGSPTALTLTVAAGVVAAALLLLPIVAFANPPDPVWLPGLYDGADGDDLATLVTETAATQERSVGQLLPPMSSAEVVLTRAAGSDTRVPALGPPRGPPQSACALADCLGCRLNLNRCPSASLETRSSRAPGATGPKLLVLLEANGWSPERSRSWSREATFPCSRTAPSRF